MASLQVHAEKREKKGKFIRSEQHVPGIVYGKEQKPVSLTLDRGEILKIYNNASGSAIFELVVKGGDTMDVLVKDIQIDAAKNRILHIDFYAVIKGQAITADVSLHFVGEPQPSDGGVLSTVNSTLTISATPKNLPESIEVNIADLAEIGDHILVSDIKLPSGVTLVDDSEEALSEPIVKIDAPREEEVEEVVEAPDASEVETTAQADGEEAAEAETEAKE